MNFSSVSKHLTLFTLAGFMMGSTIQAQPRDADRPSMPEPQDMAERSARDSELPTAAPLSQGADRLSLDTARLIRKAIMEDATLSAHAKNVKVMVAANAITLRGPVMSDLELVKVVQIANGVAPTFRITNELRVVK